MADTKGTNNIEMDDSSWFIVHEADCVDVTNSLDELFEDSTDCSNISNLIDDSVDEIDQGNSLALYNQQVTEECNSAVASLKRKFRKSPPEQSVAALSPRLQAISISPQRIGSSKRKLFEDSGIGDDETTNTYQVEPEIRDNDCESRTVQSACNELLRCTNLRAKLLFKFESFYGVSYTELTRQFKSDKTMNENWVIAVFAASCELIESSKQLLKQHCDFIQLIEFDFSGLYLVKFKHAKNRDTITKLISSLLNINERHLLCDPPRCRSTPAALYFYKHNITGKAFVYGVLPEWVAKQTQVNHQMAAQADTFQLSKMVQWAYDNKMTEEPAIAYYYALLADEDSNAAAFLNSNSQVKFVKDCCQMVRLYFRQEMKNMTMAQWIFKCCRECDGEEDWKVIANLLKYQGVNVIEFLTALRLFFKRIPKKNCILIHGPPDTGKSYFVYSLVQFLRGKVISFVNKQSSFFLQPLLDCKVGFMDDATYPCWSFIDVHLRNALDGNTMCVDAKHKAPQQYQLPPFFITSNINLKQEDSLRYLHSRVTSFEFPNKMPLDGQGDPVFKITDQAWKFFFLKLAKQLDLQDAENEPRGPERAFRCHSNAVDESL